MPPGFDGFLHWGAAYNRPYLRCLAGLGLATWRLGDLAGAVAIFERLLAMSPADPQGMRFCWAPRSGERLGRRARWRNGMEGRQVLGERRCHFSRNSRSHRPRGLS